MNRMRWPVAAFAMVTMAGCVPAVMTPTVTATPGPGKLPADFAADNTACTTQVNQQMAPVVQAANNQVANTALQNLTTGTGMDPVTASNQATAAVQQQYDTAYAACMYAKGDNVPPYYMQPTAYAGTEPEAPVRHKVRQAKKKPVEQPTATASAAPASAQPTPAFVEPTPVQPVSAGGGFAVPPPAAH
jgi:hypothetical protein